MTRPSSPTEVANKAAQELELEDESLEDTEVSPASAVKRPLTPNKSPTRVKAAAAMWENGGPTPDRPGLTSNSSNSSFRSIPASSSKTTLNPSAFSPEKQSPEPGERSLSPYYSPPTPDYEVEAATPTDNRESFAEVTLDDLLVDSMPVPISESKSYSLSPIPPPADLSSTLPEPATTPPAKELPPVKSSFFTTALGFGMPGTGLTSESSSQNPSRAASTHPSNAPGWRSTVSNLLGSRSVSSTPSAPSPATMPDSATSLRSPLAEAKHSASTSFILNRMDSPTASRDRRISREVGATERLKEGFERVRVEMEDAAREMRKADNAPSPTTPGSEGNIDWVFWGAVVQDYEEVAREQPKELSKAIQQGVPAVIRGAIWQLMSSSKSAPLEETYKALLKLPSPHEKAIAKDLSRTFPNHKYFQGGGVGQESLYMVLKAYSLYDQEVGYTQGLAFIVAALLLNMPDEEAFCVLVRLMDSYNLRSHFLADMPGLQLRLFQFDRLAEEILPLLYIHFVKKGVKSSMFASQWFMTLFSYRFPLSLVYRVLDIVFAEGVEAIFRFSLALLKKSEDTLERLGFEEILAFLQNDLFEVYRVSPESDASDPRERDEEEEWRANDFVRDAYDVRITPFMLDAYESEYEEQCRAQNKHALELDQLRNANRNLSAQVNQLEASLSTMNQEHVELVRQLVMNKIEKEETENELVRYKMLYAELAHSQQDALSTHSRFSAGSSMSQLNQL